MLMLALLTTRALDTLSHVIKILYLCGPSGSRPALRFHHSRHYLTTVIP